MFYYDSTYIFVIIGMIITVVAQMYLQSVFSKYRNVISKSGFNATMVANKIMQSHNITNVSIGRVSGNLTDHYIPSKKILNLSDSTYDNSSIASIGVAAHEVGHAIQDFEGMWILKFQIRVSPTLAIISNFSIPIIILGFMLSLLNLIYIGIIAFSATLVLQLISLPIEFDASNRAIKSLRSMGIFDESEIYCVKKVLTAAAFTYVAAAANALLQLLRFLALANRRRR